jgi:hypothetical protein
MGAERWVVAGALLALACAGKSISHGSKDGAATDCMTSFACPTGERCDDGACVRDDACPGTRDQELLFEAPPGSSWADAYDPYFTVLDGREYLVMTEFDESGARGELSHFLDLRTGRELLFVHRPGHTGCRGTPARCVLSATGAAVFAEIELGEDSVSIRPETLLAFSGYDFLFSSDADYRERRVVLTAGTIVERWQLGERSPIASIDLVDTHFLNLLVGADGRSERVLSWIQENPATGEASEVAVTALETGASSTRIYRGPGGFSAAVLALPFGDDWYLLRDGRPGDAPPVSVYRSDGAVTLVGTLDASWAMGVDYEYRNGERPLEPGPSAYVRHCDEGGCGSYRFYLDPVSLEQVARIALPEPGFRVSYSRAIACGGADLWVATQSSDDAPTRYWSLRIPGRVGSP